ncbi:uncharacterized protein LOC130957281 [Arachis stenosperma]|uniref:uncharacterized protein LOC130957281 n=1 Tax=Arachis stenosperma TaxID=217475 RepID=UPI0025AD9706|nr:uncharacterized protein LOC130957281 [Arachis stenosperma]
MRQKRWMELLKDYDFELSYHAGKANVVVNALSRKSLTIAWMRIKEEELVEKFVDLKLDVVLPAIEQGKQWRVSWDQDGLWRFKGRIVVPDVRTLWQDILKEAHKSGFSIHPGNTKMYHDLKAMFWWLGMKNDVAEHVSKFLTCQNVKIEHQ